MPTTRPRRPAPHPTSPSTRPARDAAWRRLPALLGAAALLGACHAASGDADTARGGAPAAGGVAAAATAAAAVGAVAEAGPTFRDGCDGSAAVALGDQYLAVANDDDNTLRVYRADSGGAPVAGVPIGTALGFADPSDEADIEGAAAAGDTIYWITSHGRSGKKVKFSPNRHRLFATTWSTSGPTPVLRVAGFPDSTLLAALSGDTALRRFALDSASTRGPEVKGGLNIEGLAMSPEGALLIGFRNPVPGDRALVVTLRNPADVVFRRQAPAFGRPATLDLGRRGVRSLEYVPGLRAYLIVAGATDSTKNFALYRWSGDADSAATPVPGIDLGGLRPEALVARGGGRDRLLLLSDDGDERVGAGNCKKALDSLKSFRSLRVALP